MLENKYHLTTVFLFLALFFIAYLVPISDIDFWWHIASGRYILETGSIPSVDPFHVFDDSNPIRNTTILKGYWLGQIILFKVYDLFSSFGLIVFRAVILIACLFFIYLRILMFKVTGLSMWLSLLLAALVLQGFTGERPQLFSFLFMALFLFLWDFFRQKERRLWLLPLPLILVVWSNIHGGFLLGLVVMSLLVGMHALTSPNYKGWTYRWLFPVGFIATLLLASMINPTGLDTHTLLFQFEGSEAQNRSSEYISSLAIFRYGMWYEQVLVGLFLVLSCIAIFDAYRERTWDRLLILVFLMLISLDAYRYLAFFVIVATPYIAESLMRFESGLFRSSKIYTKWLERGGLIAVSIAFAISVSLYQPGWTKDRFAELNEGLKMLGQQHGAGFAFNTMNIGGYLIWHLGPNIRTFIDGRMIDDKKLIPYTHILWTTDYGKKWFDQYGFDWVIMSTKNQFTGESYSLVPYLLGQGKWNVYFKTDDWIILERKSLQAY